VIFWKLLGILTVFAFLMHTNEGEHSQPPKNPTLASVAPISKTFRVARTAISSKSQGKPWEE
jgi:hypothetical protein